MSQYLPLKDNTQKAKEFVELFQSKLEELVGKNDLPPGMVIAILANLNFHGLDMPVSVFKQLDYKQGWETPEDPIIVGEALKRIKGDKVVIDRTERYKIGEFQLQYNFVRGFRPKRGAKLDNITLNQDFGNPKFHYGLPAVDPEVFRSVEYGNDLTVDFVFNRYPFAPYHFLWIPNRKKGNHSEYLDPDKDRCLIEAAWDFVTNQGLGEGVRLCYNSNGAHASVNHLHLQGFFLTQNWEPPFEEIARRHDGSSTIDCYFAGTRWIPASDGAEGLKKFIREINGKYAKGEEIAFNFRMGPDGIACFPRKHQGDKKYFKLLEQAPFTTGYAFFEMLGEIISPTADVPIFGQDRTEKKIRDLYNALSLEQTGSTG